MNDNFQTNTKLNWKGFNCQYYNEFSYFYQNINNDINKDGGILVVFEPMCEPVTL